MPEIKSEISLLDRLLRYSALASMAAASGVLIAPSPVNAVTRDVNCVMDATGDICVIDFDNDGHPEFQLELDNPYPSDLWMQFRSGSGDAGLRFINSNASAYAAVLPHSGQISAGRTDWTSATFGPGIAFWTSFGIGNWKSPQGHATDPSLGAYAGLEFQLDSAGTHYGWIELYFASNDNVTVKRIGYNATAGASIPAGQDADPAAVQLSTAGAASGLRGVMAGAFIALAGVFTWLRRKTA